MSDLSQIRERIRQAKEAYYRSGRTIMSDAEYDRLVAQAEKLGYIETVGSRPADDIPQIRHEHQMLSLDKVHTLDEVGKFADGHGIVVMYKADGLTCSATYEGGVLVRLETRGNGQVGNDILHHAASFENLPLHIDREDRFVIDGEAVILYGDFEKINEKLPEDQKYKNPRNLAAGTLNLLDPSISKQRHLKFFAWDVIEGSSEKYLSNSLAEAEKLGFSVVKRNLFTKYDAEEDRESIRSWFDNFREEAREEGFPIDGIVIKYDDIEYGRSLGFTGHHFRNAVAYKFEDDRFPTRLKYIEWTMGKTGSLTPVLNFEPVEIDGTIVERASAHNVSILRQLGLTNGCTVYIYKANQIIPQCDGCEEDGDGPVKIPDTCPVCGGKAEIVSVNSTQVLTCTNPDCSGKMLGKYSHFVSKKAMDIDGLSETTLEKFMDMGFLNSFTDIYALKDKANLIAGMEGFGEKSAKKLVEALDKSRKNVRLARFVTALSIPGIGEGQMRLIAPVLPTWEEFRDAAEGDYDFSAIDGIGDVLNSSIHSWFSNQKNRMQAQSLADMMEFAVEEKNDTSSSPISGKTFVITGAVYHFANRDELKKKIEELGGKASGSVSKKTDYLINNDNTSSSSKNLKARELGIPVITEEEFLKMIG